MPETESEIEQANIAYPERQFEVEKAIPEVVHRYFAGTLGLLIFGLFFIAIIAKTKDKWLKNLIFAATLLVCVQSLFGYLTVSLKLWPQVVTLHLLGGFFTTTLVFLIFLRSSHLRASFNINFSVLPNTNTLLNWAFPFLLAQIVLGISNIYFQVPLYVAIAHNLGALFLLMYLSFVRLKSSTISPA
jgi:cytochrome c oxidase assembly protein subunit 15